MGKKDKEPLAINVNENWGGLESPGNHTAAIGARMIDNRMRDLQVLPDRCTVIGDRDTVVALQKWLFSNKTMKSIKRNTSFSWGLDDMNCWTTKEVIGRNKNIHVALRARCSGEYCYVAAYADIINCMREDET